MDLATATHWLTFSVSGGGAKRV
eukprot:SAG31_NODE_43711_length_266_cov_0.598802_1_plen_22_part_01